MDLHKVEILPLLLFAAALLALSFIGCASLPVMPALQQTDVVLKSDIIKPGHTITVGDSQVLTKTLTDDATIMQGQQATIIKQDKTIVSGAFWRRFGIGSAIVGVLICIGIITTGVIKFLRLLKIIP